MTESSSSSAAAAEASTLLVTEGNNTNSSSTNRDSINNEHVHEWLGLPLNDWSTLKLLAEVQGNVQLSNKASRLICAIRARRAAAVSKVKGSTSTSSSSSSSSSSSGGERYHVRNTGGKEATHHESDPSTRIIDIKSFPIEYSMQDLLFVRAVSIPIRI